MPPAAQSVLVNSAHFSSETIDKLCGLLEDAWAMAEHGPEHQQEARRLVLAAALLDLARAGQTDPQELKQYALSRLRGYLATEAKRQLSVAQASAHRSSSPSPVLTTFRRRSR